MSFLYSWVREFVGLYTLIMNKCKCTARQCKYNMGDQISCCDAKGQLDNVSVLNKLGEESTLNTIKPFQVPPMSEEIRQLITKAQIFKYYRAKNETPSTFKQTIIYGHHKNGAIYEGQTSNQLADGFGTVRFINGSFFQGIFSNGEPINGIFAFNDKCYYVGDIEKYQACGDGIYENIENGYFYQGQWKKNLQHGQGIEKYSNSDQYNGTFMCGSKFGEGEYKFADGRVYKGSFYNGHSDGHGVLTLPNGQSYEGEWKLGEMHGRGLYKWKNGEKYEGEYVNGVRSGQGKYFFANGACYEGGWADGVQEGEGVIRQGFDEVRGVWGNGLKIA